MYCSRIHKNNNDLSFTFWDKTKTKIMLKSYFTNIILYFTPIISNTLQKSKILYSTLLFTRKV